MHRDVLVDEQFIVNGSHEDFQWSYLSSAARRGASFSPSTLSPSPSWCLNSIVAFQKNKESARSGPIYSAELRWIRSVSVWYYQLSRTELNSYHKKRTT